MRNTKGSLFLSVLLAGCATGGGGGTSDPLGVAPADTTAAVQEAGGLKVTQLEWDAELLSIPERARDRYDNDKGKKDIAERILLNEALYNKAVEAGITADPVVQMSARQAAMKAYVAALMSKVEADAASDAAVQKHYEENREKYDRPMVRARHILVKDEALAQSLYTQIQGGADFAALAKEHSEDRGSKAKGGELPWATRDRWVPEFADAAFGLEVNGIGKPVQTKFGWHIIQALEKREQQPLEDVRPGIERVLTRNAVRDYREEVKKGLGIADPEPPKMARPPAGAPGEDGKVEEGKPEVE